MAEAEQPDRLRPAHQVTVDDVRQLMGASTPHFALQLRNRIRKLIAPLPPGDPARLLGEQEIARLERLGYTRRDARRGLPGRPAAAAVARTTTPRCGGSRGLKFVAGAWPRRNGNGAGWGSGVSPTSHAVTVRRPRK